MSLSSEKIALRLDKEGKKNTIFFEGIPSNAWGLPIYSDGAAWNLKDLLTHIVEAENSILRLIVGLLETGRGVPEDFDLDRYNERKVREAGDKSPDKLIELFCVRRAQTIETVSQLNTEDLLIEGKHPFLGYATVGEMLKLMYLHVQLHIRDIRREMDGRV